MNCDCTGQSDDLAETAESARESVNLTSPVAESPWSTQKEVVDAFREETDDDTKIRNSQVDNQHVSRSAKGLVMAKDLKHHHVASKSDYSYIYYRCYKYINIRIKYQNSINEIPPISM